MASIPEIVDTEYKGHQVRPLSFIIAEDIIDELVDNIGVLLNEQRALNLKKKIAISDFKSISNKAVRHKFIKQDQKIAQVDKVKFGQVRFGPDQAD